MSIDKYYIGRNEVTKAEYEAFEAAQEAEDAKLSLFSLVEISAILNELGQDKSMRKRSPTLAKLVELAKPDDE